MAGEFDQIDEPLGNPDGYTDMSLADPDAPDVEIELPDGDLNEDGSYTVGGEDEEVELPPMDQVPHSSNLVSYFENDELNEIADNLISAWEEDDAAREEWKKAYVKGLELLGMTNEERTEPFEGASGVHHPLLAEAVVQFQAQAYKELLPAGGPVLTKVLGNDNEERVAQANRVQDFLNYLIVDVMEEYDANMDQLLFYLPIGGSAFKKTYFDPIRERSVSEFITAEHITVPYNSKDLTSTTRITHDFMLDGNDLLKYQANGFYSDAHEAKAMGDGDGVSEIQDATDELSGVSANYFQHDERYQLIECHVNMDHELLASDDGVALPYIVTIDVESKAVLAIRRNYAEGDPLMKKMEHFTHYKFLPGLGFYGFGLVHMIGGIAGSVTSILRQLVDAGTFANLPGGFKAKGMRVAGEDEPLMPGEWRDVDSPGGNLRESLMPLPYKEPSQVLAALLGNLVESGQRFASIADMQVGDSGSQQQPVGTTVAMLERGTKVMSSIHKRLHNAQKHEFKILARIVKETIGDEPYPYATEGSEGEIAAKDFDDRVDVIPVSDPNIFSMAQRVMLATQQLQMAQAAPEVHNVREAYKRMYVAMGIKDIEEILKPEEKPQPLTPMEENRKVLQNQMLVAVPEMNHEAHIQAHIMLLKHPAVATSPEFGANIIQDVMNHISLMAKAQAEQTKQPPDQIELQLFEKILPELTPPQSEDPMAALQSRQLDIDEANNQGKLRNDAVKDHNKSAIDIAAIESDERIAEGKLLGKQDEVNINARVAIAAQTVKRQGTSTS